MNDVERCISEWVDRVNERDATIAALQARVKELEEWVQDQSTANLETMRHTDEMQSRAMEVEQQLTQRTAELEALRKWRDYVTVALQRPGGAFFEDVPKHIIDLVAELERVRGDVNTLNQLLRDKGLGQGEIDGMAADLEELTALRTLIAALPKVEGEIVAKAGYLKDKDRVYALFASDEVMNAHLALWQHRQGMEG